MGRDSAPPGGVQSVKRAMQAGTRFVGYAVRAALLVVCLAAPAYLLVANFSAIRPHWNWILGPRSAGASLRGAQASPDGATRDGIVPRAGAVRGAKGHDRSRRGPQS